MKNTKKIIPVLLCLIVILGPSCRPSARSDDPDSLGQTVTVVRGDLIVSVSGNGTVAVSTDVKLAFDKGGRVARIYVTEGEEVVAGQTLALLEPINTGALELAVKQAEAVLAQAEYDLDKAKNPYTDEDIEEAREAVEDAEDWLDLTDEMLRYAIKSGDNQQITQWQMENLKAENQLEMAEDKLDDMLSERDEDQIAVLEDQAVAARMALDEAWDALEAETLLAPFSGVVATVYLDEGKVVPAPGISQVPVIQMIDAANLELDVSLDEIDAPSVKAGQRAIITLDAIPDAEFEGRVISIGPLPTVEAGVVSYLVKVTFSPPKNQGVRIGMSATADIVTDERLGVLVVPDGAVSYDSEGNPKVKVVLLGETGDQPQISERKILTGISDGFETEVVSGLTEGETVLMDTSATSSRQGNTMPFFGD